MLKLLLLLQNYLKNRTFISILLVFKVKKIGTLKGLIRVFNIYLLKCQILLRLLLVIYLALRQFKGNFIDTHSLKAILLRCLYLITLYFYALPGGLRPLRGRNILYMIFVKISLKIP